LTLHICGRALRLALIISVVISAPFAFADVRVQTDFAFSFSNSVFNAAEYGLAPYLKAEKSVAMEDFSMTTPVATQIRGIQANLKYEFGTGMKFLHVGAEGYITSRSFEMSLAIREIQSQGEVEIPVSGGKFRLRVDALCKDINIKLSPGAVTFHALLKSDLDENGQLKITVPWLNWALAPGSWKIDPIRCTGTPGYEDKLRSSLTDWLEDSANWDRLIRTKIQEELAKLQARINLEFAKVRQVAQSSSKMVGATNISLQAERIEKVSGQDRLILHGKVNFNFISNVESYRTVHFRGSPRFSGNWQLALPEETLSNLFDASVATENLFREHSGDTISGFKDLMASALKSALVWPELNQYATADQFMFRPQLAGTASAVLDQAPRADGEVFGTLRAPLKVSMLVKSGKTFRTMMLFDFPISATIQPVIEGQQFKVKLTGINSKLDARWDNYTPSNSTMDLDTIHSRVRDGLADPAGMILFDISDVKLTSAMTLKVKTLKRLGANLLIQF
jgi:hypothetical protein